MEQLGWMIDPDTKTVEVYRPDREPELLSGLESLAGEGPVDGFVLDLRKVWDPPPKSLGQRKGVEHVR